MQHHTLSTLVPAIAIELPADVWWADEFDWTPIAENSEYSLTGSLIIDIGVRQAGRPITLTSNANGGWVHRSTVQDLQAQRDAPNATATLVLADGRTLTVKHDRTRPFEAAPVRPASDMTAATAYRTTLPLIEI